MFRSCKGLVVIKNLALRRGDQPGQDAKEGGFAAARGAQEGHDFPFVDAKVDVFQDLKDLPLGRVKSSETFLSSMSFCFAATSTVLTDIRTSTTKVLSS